MLRRIYIQFITLLAILSYAGNAHAQEHILIPVAGQKVYVPLTEPSVKGKIVVSNFGRTRIQDIDYTLSFNGKELESKHYTLPQTLGHNDDAVIEVAVPPYTELGEDELTFTITKVNGGRNGATISEARIPRVTVTKVAKRKVVVEEYTAMWCRYCPSGIALMENLSHTFGDDFVGIAVHADDPLTCWDYYAKAREDSRRPSLYMNRSRKLGYVKAVDEFKAEQDAGADMDLEVSAEWDKEKNNITVTPAVTFRLNREKAPYGFAYVLTEDGMSRPEWFQNNAYAGSESDRGVTKEFDVFIDSPSEIRNLKNNFVAIAAAGVEKPVANLIEAPIKADQTQSHSYIFKDVSKIKVLQDKAKLKVCVLLINKQTGKIENAAKCSIADAQTTSISSVSDRKETAIETARYTLDGRRITAPQKGINIVKYSDGRVRKEVITQ